MTGFIVSVFPSRNRVSSKEAFEGLELGERKLSRTVLRGLDGSNAVWLLGHSAGNPLGQSVIRTSLSDFRSAFDQFTHNAQIEV